MGQVTYTQCRLRHVAGRWDEVWIPTEFAHVGRRLRIKDENGWTVAERGVTRSAESLAEYERDHLHQREASDI